ncbi:MAG: type II toxin-antitoxin system RelE/ParE family toxin [Saprospiraceae bacterium]|nr:type II toxin-antitoxin system RelE/ParE family toxin [Saprospiraceae bacterium]
MARLNWSDQAIFDLVNIAEFIAKDSDKYAKITITRIRIAARQLKTYPSCGRIVPEISSENIRELILGNYRIIYCIVSPNQIDILTVHHSAKRLDFEELKKQTG